MNNDFIARAAEIVKKNTVGGGEFTGQICTLSLIDEQGFPTMSILTPSESDGINWITFCTLVDENRAKRSIACNRASVCFGAAGYCVNLVGEIEVITSADIKREMWYDALEGHFAGADDPNYCVLKFTTKRYKLFMDGEDIAGIL